MIIKSNIKRLLQYRICLGKFKELGFTRVYSYNLGNAAGVSPEQVRKDFSTYGITGNKKAGYEISSLLEILNRLFGMDKTHNIIIVGMGNMGRALANYNERFITQHVYIYAAFDMDPSKHNKTSGMPVFPLSKIPDIVSKNDITTAIISVPAIAAQEVCNLLIDVGIKGILNFAPIVLKVPDHVVINHLNLSTEIDAIIYYLNEKLDTR
ncbi:MAG: redox-sensing transcriptional repressor Rex [Bacteroidales bacterium]|nr:redox-sensing transcriptional repressor Rex [Bacteroidales bacterium]